MPKISVIIPCYNVSGFIPKNINYILNQTLKQIEVFFVNDGSTDKTAIECEKVAKADPRVRVVHKKNEGAGSARNAGLELAKGEYIYFYDIDDVIDLDLLERIYAKAINEKAEIVMFGFDVYDATVGTHDKIRFEDIVCTDNNELKKIFCDEVYFKLHGNGFVWNKLYKRKFIEENNFHFGDERIQQDEIFNLKLYRKAQKVVLTSQSGYYYYFNLNISTGAKYVDKKFESVTSVFNSLQDFYANWSLENVYFLKKIHMRYCNSILNVVCYNFFVKGCTLSYSQKIKKIREITISREFRECKEFIGNDHSLRGMNQFFWWCLIHGYIHTFLNINYLYSVLKRIGKKVM